MTNVSLTLSTYHVCSVVSFHSKVYTSLYINVHITNNKCQNGYLCDFRTTLMSLEGYSSNQFLTDLNVLNSAQQFEASLNYYYSYCIAVYI